MSDWCFEKMVETKLDHIITLLTGLQAQGEHMAATLDQVLEKVTRESTDIDSVLTLVTGLKQQLADALSGASLPPAVQAKVDAIFDTASASAGKIAAALQANVTT